MDSWDQVQVLIGISPDWIFFLNFIIIYFYSMFDLFTCFIFLSTQGHARNAKGNKEITSRKSLQSLGLDELCFY